MKNERESVEKQLWTEVERLPFEHPIDVCATTGSFLQKLDLQRCIWNTPAELMRIIPLGPSDQRQLDTQKGGFRRRLCDQGLAAKSRFMGGTTAFATR